ncbi:MAG: DNA-binding protein WhiA [Clostridia bacterium]|nr:DNA-binding protein WhiA [Clostridia bacterium]
MSFTAEIKRELSGQTPRKACCELAMLATFYALLSEEQRNEIHLKTENITIARRIIILSRKHLGLELEPDIRSTRSKTRKQIYLTVSGKENIDILKNELKMVSEKANIFQSRIAPSFSLDDCCKRAVLQAAFLVSGFVNSPKKSYHLEISTHKKRVFSDLMSIFLDIGIEVKSITRQNKYVLYLKNNELICDFLGMIGVKRGLFQYHEIKMEKELKNGINRQMNCESANENKTINTALLQTQAIQKIMQSARADTLSDALKETMRLRLCYPTMSLSELCEVSETKITKSGLNHRLNKLIQIAETL